MSDIQIRDAHLSDHEAIRIVTLAAYQEYAALMPRLWEPYRRNILTTLANVSPAEQILAEQDGRILGSVLLYPMGTTFSAAEGASIRLQWPEVRLLAVDPDQRGQGIGTALMQECIHRARQAGAAWLMLHTTDMMRTAMQMYEHMGFARAPELDWHPVPEVTVKAYRFSLAEAGQSGSKVTK
jgi:GNAT superfamily N-acetyltransferase